MALRSLSLFDPYQIVRNYIIQLESMLKKACLLSEFWETGNGSVTMGEKWRNRVRGCKSIGILSRLVLKFVDHIHARAFEPEWYHNGNVKGVDSQSPERHSFKDLPSGWNEKDEKRKKIWESTPPEILLHLVEKEGSIDDGACHSQLCDVDFAILRYQKSKYELCWGN